MQQSTSLSTPVPVAVPVVANPCFFLALHFSPILHFLARPTTRISFLQPCFFYANCFSCPLSTPVRQSTLFPPDGTLFRNPTSVRSKVVPMGLLVSVAIKLMLSCCCYSMCLPLNSLCQAVNLSVSQSVSQSDAPFTCSQLEKVKKRARNPTHLHLADLHFLHALPSFFFFALSCPCPVRRTISTRF
jgi:hypothetical protein